jgi:hypothetical protein
MLWARLLAYVSGTVDQELLLRNEYLIASEADCGVQGQVCIAYRVPNLWASWTEKKSSTFFVVFENTDKTQTIRGRQEKGLPTGVSEALAA